MIQLYFITMLMLIIASFVFLSDYYGWKYVILLKTRNYIESKSLITGIFIFSVSLLILLNCFFPISPGPILLGEFLVLIALLIFLIYLIIVSHGQISKKKEEVKEKENDKKKNHGAHMMDRTHSLIETHKRNIGFFISIVILLHLIFPKGVIV